jgi:hypothetical protein
MRHSPELGIVAELVQEPSSAERPFNAAVDPDSAVVELMRHGTVTAVEFATICDGLQFFQHRAVGPAGSARRLKKIDNGTDCRTSSANAWMPPELCCIGMTSSARFATSGSSEMQSWFGTGFMSSSWHSKLILKFQTEESQLDLAMGRCTPCWSARPEKRDWFSTGPPASSQYAEGLGSGRMVAQASIA